MINSKKVLLLLSAVSALAYAENTPITMGGSARIRAEENAKTDALTDRSFTSIRVRPNFTATPDAHATLFFEPQFAKIFGEPTVIPSSTTANAAQDTSGATYDPALTVHQAYVDVSPTTWNNTLLGRQVLSYGDELVFGPADWTLTGRTFDAFKSRSKYGLGWSDLVIAKVQDNNTVSSSSSKGDKDIYGIYTSLNLHDYLKALDLYVFDSRDSTAKDRINMWTVGARLKSDVESFDYRFETTKQFTYVNNTEGSQLRGLQGDAEFGYTVHKESKSRVGAEVFYADKNYNQLYPTGHKWLGYADMFGRRNISGYVFHAAGNPTDALKVTFDYHQFYRVSTADPAYKLNGTTALGSAAANDTKALASEFDLTAKYQFSPKLSMSGGGALVKPSAYLTEQLNLKNMVGFYYVDLQISL